jgi:predicted nucleotidyltransferase
VSSPGPDSGSPWPPANFTLAVRTGYSVGMVEPDAPARDEVIRRLRAAEHEIRLLGVRRLALFGSVQRDDAGSDSDVDLLVEFAPGRKSFARLLDLAELLERTVGHPVDLVTLESLSPYLGPHILAEASDVLRAA